MWPLTKYLAAFAAGQAFQIATERYRWSRTVEAFINGNNEYRREMAERMGEQMGTAVRRWLDAR